MSYCTPAKALPLAVPFWTVKDSGYCKHFWTTLQAPHLLKRLVPEVLFPSQYGHEVMLDISPLVLLE